MPTPDPRVTATFSPHAVPAAFQALDHFAFDDGERLYPFGDCCLAAPDDAAAWLGEGAAARAAAQLHVWLRGPAGYLYAFWSHDGRPMLDAPIVYLDDEGDGSAVVADNLDEFLGIVANGFDRLHPGGVEPAPEELPAAPQPFFTSRSIAPLPDWAARIAAAARRHPDFDAWLAAVLKGSR